MLRGLAISYHLLSDPYCHTAPQCIILMMNFKFILACCAALSVYRHAPQYLLNQMKDFHPVWDENYDIRSQQDIWLFNSPIQIIQIIGPPLWSSGQSFWLQIQRSRVRFLALPVFLSSSGSGTGSTQPREGN